jgi:arylsulfatase A-like enzyme
MTRFLVSILALAVLVTAAPATAADRPNVLFIAVDDLRPELGCYGADHIKSPAIDRLAAEGIVFEKAFCMVPTCGASRAALMTSIRPARNRFVTHLAWADKEAPGRVTLNTHFQANGYHTVSLGKIFHHSTDSKAGWSEEPWKPKGPQYRLPENVRIQEANAKDRGPAYEMAEVDDTDYGDGKLAERAIADLQRLSQGDKPFFLAVGFFKPHLPFVAPKKYWDLYDRETIQLPPNFEPPVGAPAASLHNSGELRNYAGIPAQGPLPEDLARTLIHGYYACVSYTDAQIGKLLAEVDRLGLKDDTIVILWGDHGWNLGNHGLWCKHSCYESSLHAPLILRVPGKTSGQKTPRVVEFIDVYPTLCQLCDLPLPSHVQGRSLVPLIESPEAPWTDLAISRFGNGDSIRNSDLRYTEYTNAQGGSLGRMLYENPTAEGETKNVVKAPKHADAVSELKETLHERMGRDGQLPE